MFCFLFHVCDVLLLQSLLYFNNFACRTGQWRYLLPRTQGIFTGGRCLAYDNFYDQFHCLNLDTVYIMSLIYYICSLCSTPKNLFVELVIGELNFRGHDVSSPVEVIYQVMTFFNHDWCLANFDLLYVYD